MEFQTILRHRRTIRSFRQSAVPDETLEAMIDAARRSSCAANLQPLRYVIARTPELAEAILPHTRWAGFIAPARTPEKAVDAPPVFIAVTAPASAGDNVLADAGAAIQSMELAAWELGIGCCWIGSVDRDAVAKILDIPEGQRILYLVAAGYPAESPISEDTDREDAIKYYLDGSNILHVPKLTTDAITTWK